MKFDQSSKRLRGRAAVERRKSFLARHPLCVKCQEAGVVSAAEEVDHIVPLFKGGADDETNLQSLCRDCHELKTRDDLGWKAKSGADANGFPLDPHHHWNR